MGNLEEDIPVDVVDTLVAGSLAEGRRLSHTLLEDNLEEEEHRREAGLDCNNS